MEYPNLRGCCLLLLCCFTLSTATVAAPGVSDSPHPSISLDDSLSLQQVLEASLARAPELTFSQAYQKQAQTGQALSNGLSPQAPRFTFSYWDDQTFDNTGALEIEAGIEFDLWRWGQQDNAETLAESFSAGSQAWQNHFTLMVAGRVRQALHRLAMARAYATHAEQAVTDAEKLLHTSQKRFAAGGAPQSAVMQSKALVLEAKQQQLDKNAELVDAIRSYHILTGLYQAPADLSEASPQQYRINEQHPTLAFLLARRQQQTALVEQQRYQGSGSPTVRLGLRRDRGSDLEPDIDSLGFSISIPFGTSRYAKANSSAANIALAELDTQIQLTRRELQQQLHDIQHQLHTLEITLQFAAERRDINRQNWEMAQTAFSVGESDIRPTIIALQQYRQSQLHWQQLKLQQQALIASYKQTVGELP